MRKIVLASVAAMLLAASSLMPNRAEAMVPTPAGVRTAIDATSVVDSAACRLVWRCGHWGCGWRRICWGPYWGGGYGSGPYWGYGGWRGPGWGWRGGWRRW